MDIILVYDKAYSEFIQKHNTEIEDKIKSISKMLEKSDISEHTDIHFINGKLNDMPEEYKIVVLISSKSIANNLGAAIVEFKNKFLEFLTEYEINLNRDALHVRVNSAENVKKILESSQKRHMKQNDKESSIDEFDYEKKSRHYTPVEPAYSFDRIILDSDVIAKIEEAIAILQCENKVFKQWGLYEIQPHPSTSLSFYGPSGTGKTMAAEAVAQKLGKKILKVSYADVESKYHGEGPKMVKAIFLAAEKSDAVLFFDEADSLLSKRLTNVSQGSEQAINSMRSQLLICLEEFRGIVIFATNLVVNYDQAFLTRLINVEFPLPDMMAREKIWNVHIRPLPDGKEHKLNIPLSDDVDTKILAEKYEFVGREIRNAVVSACVSVAMKGEEIVCQNDFIVACDKIQKEKELLAKAKDYTQKASPEQELLKEAVLNKIKKESKE